MPLWLLVSLVTGGIAGIALALHLLGLSQRRLLDPAGLQDEWRRHFPDDTFDAPQGSQFLLTGRRDRALLYPDQGAGLLWVMGADTTARRLSHARWSTNSRDAVCHFPDPGAPRVVVSLADPAERDLWLAHLRKQHGLS